MKDSVHVHGECRFEGDSNLVHDLLMFWEVDEAAENLAKDAFLLSGEVKGPVEDSTLEAALQHFREFLEDVSSTVEVKSGRSS